MNDLYLIGNGFDLAHGLKTSYNDFLLWYLKRSMSRYSPNKHFEDDLIIVTRPYNNSIQDHTSLSELFVECDQLQITIKYKHAFFEHIVKGFRVYRWVDVEYEYYMALVKLYKELELNPHTRKSILKQLKQLNLCFELIKKELIKYLTSIEISGKLANKQIQKILTEGTGPECQYIGEKLFLYFNYTSTLELYDNISISDKNKIIYIHGKLEKNDNPIIFGYGDEMDPYNEKIELLKENEFLNNFKSFGYFKTSNYQDFIRFVDSKEFTVKILGHSCGLSDRILLNTVFEHKNCRSIKIFYYQKDHNENDYFEKTQEISRHFKASGKGDMRRKIVPYSKSFPLVPFDEIN